MKAKIITLGCKVNQYESEAMLEALLAGGGLYCEMFRRQAAWYRDTAEGGEA